MAEAATPDDARLERLERRLAREREKVRVLESMIEDKTRSLYTAHEETTSAVRFLEGVLRCMDSAVIVTDENGIITSLNGSIATLLEQHPHELEGRPVFELLHVPNDERFNPLDRLLESSGEAELATPTGSITVLLATSALTDDDGLVVGAVCVASDITDRKRLETELQSAQRLESVGQLAAGVAHEINTPIQFVGDSVHFLGDVLNDLLALTETYAAFREGVRSGQDVSPLIEAVEEAEDDLDLEFVTGMVPAALKRTFEGVERVSTIVKAMKRFSHPGTEHHSPEDLNEIVETTLAVTRNEYKYVADVDFAPGEIPHVMCDRGDLSQSILNIVINAAQAIEEHAAGPDDRGSISIATRTHNGGVSLTIRDSGGGIPLDIRERVFDPFFTTKEPGKGTGQGLSFCHTIITEGHQGRLTLDVEDGVGTTFHIWIPPEVTSDRHPVRRAIATSGGPTIGPFRRRRDRRPGWASTGTSTPPTRVHVRLCQRSRRSPRDPRDPPDRHPRERPPDAGRERHRSPLGGPGTAPDRGPLRPLG